MNWVPRNDVPNVSSSSRSGLAGLVERTLGLPLDKNEQVSAWSRRPLTERQLTYAALDAFVLIEVVELFI